MRKTITAYKRIGESPLDLINRLREEQPELKDEKMAYAGRLDPMAEGLVLIVIGKELKNFDHYLKMDKEYEAKMLFGFSSDTYDILGIAEKSVFQQINKMEVEKVLQKMEGEFNFSLPPFSSYKIRKKPLFWWALKDRLQEIQIPKKKVFIYSLDVVGREYLSAGELQKEILGKIKKVKGNFRQEEVIKRWERVFSETEREEKYLVLTVKITCSSGCYARSIAHEAGKRLKTGAVLLHLKRTRIRKIQNT